MDIIDIIILITIAISGTVFGSFFTLAVHRIPRKEDITHERSYCPKCNHKLQFLDLIPVFSYIFLGGKCRYCKEKIRPRYLLLEIMSGLVFLLLGLSYNIGIESTLIDLIAFAILILFLCSVFIIGGIDKEKYEIPNGVLLYGILISCAKIILSGIMGQSAYANIVGFLAIPLILMLVNIITTKIFSLKIAPFGGGDIKYIAMLGLYLGFGGQVLCIEISLLLILIHKLWQMIRRSKANKIAWGFYLSIAATLVLIAVPRLTDLLEAFDFMIKV